MATATLTPTNYWQVDYGTVVAKNPETRRLASYSADESANVVEHKRAVFLEFSVPTDAVQHHISIADMQDGETTTTPTCLLEKTYGSQDTRAFVEGLQRLS